MILQQKKQEVLTDDLPFFIIIVHFINGLNYIKELQRFCAEHMVPQDKQCHPK